MSVSAPINLLWAKYLQKVVYVAIDRLIIVINLNTNETPHGQNQFIESNLVNDYIDVGTILLEMMKSLRQPMRLLIQILMVC